MAMKITDSFVKSLDPPASGSRIIYDSDIRGFGVRVTARSVKAFVYNYRIKGRERRYTIGQYPGWSVEAARREAKNLMQRVYHNEDPMGDRHADRGAPTVDDMAKRYLQEYATRKRTGNDDACAWEMYIKPAIGRMKVSEVRYVDIENLHRGMASIPYRANRVLALTSTMFNLAMKWEMRPDNPCRGVERYHEERRERYLSQKEMARLFDALTRVPADMAAAPSAKGRVYSDSQVRWAETAANAIRLLILTGARRNEVLRATWDQFDLQTGIWTKPSSHTKQKKIHRVPLSAPARQLLSEMQDRTPSKWVCPGRQPDEPLTDIKKFWAKVKAEADIKDVRIHDLRHTYASILASRGASLTMVGALLGHTQPSTTARYAHLFDEPLREATEAVGSYVSDATTTFRNAEGVSNGE
ncbi:MAG: site-specific integrase [Alphaproteobacteria bacterium]